jgi:hypothetical protein
VNLAKVYETAGWRGNVKLSWAAQNSTKVRVRMVVKP